MAKFRTILNTKIQKHMSASGDNATCKTSSDDLVSNAHLSIQQKLRMGTLATYVYTNLLTFSFFPFVVYYFGLSLLVNHLLCKSWVHACICVIFSSISTNVSEGKNNLFGAHIKIYMALLIYILDTSTTIYSLFIKYLLNAQSLLILTKL